IREMPQPELSRPFYKFPVLKFLNDSKPSFSGIYRILLPCSYFFLCANITIKGEFNKYFAVLCIFHHSRLLRITVVAVTLVIRAPTVLMNKMLVAMSSISHFESQFLTDCPVANIYHYSNGSETAALIEKARQKKLGGRRVRVSLGLLLH